MANLWVCLKDVWIKALFIRICDAMYFALYSVVNLSGVFSPFAVRSVHSGCVELFLNFFGVHFGDRYIFEVCFVDACDLTMLF